jgi:uncharacterized protein (DUF1697 family)
MTTTSVVLLRGVNVGKHNRIAMADLRALLSELGTTDVRTYLQSGNAVVTADPATLDPSDLGVRLEQSLLDRLGLSVRVLIRSAEELRAVVENNPFPDKVSTPKLLHVAFLEHPIDSATVDALGRRHGDDEIAPGDRALYVSYRERSFDSPVNAVLAKLPGSVTTRNWTTVTKLLELAEA